MSELGLLDFQLGEIIPIVKISLTIFGIFAVAIFLNTKIFKR